MDSPKPGTPLPWKISKSHRFPNLIIGRTENPVSQPEVTQNATYIVHAANTLPQLEAEILRLREALERYLNAEDALQDAEKDFSLADEEKSVIRMRLFHSRQAARAVIKERS